MDVVCEVTCGNQHPAAYKVKYFDELEKVLADIEPIITYNMGADNKINSRWIALRLWKVT